MRAGYFIVRSRWCYRYHEAMAVYDWICLVEPVSCSETIQRTYDLIAYIATTFPHRQEASDQLDALLAKDSKGERAQRVRQNRKWHGKTAQKQAGKSHGSVGHGGALALWGIPGFQESSVKEDFAQVWHEAAHLAIECVVICGLCVRCACAVLCSALTCAGVHVLQCEQQEAL